LAVEERLSRPGFLLLARSSDPFTSCVACSVNRDTHADPAILRRYLDDVLRIRRRSTV
jgi:hypothetical protein